MLFYRAHDSKNLSNSASLMRTILRLGFSARRLPIRICLCEKRGVQMAYCAACLSVNSGELPNVALTRADFASGLSLAPIVPPFYQSQDQSTSLFFNIHQKTAALPSLHAVARNGITSAFVVKSGAKLTLCGYARLCWRGRKCPGGVFIAENFRAFLSLSYGPIRGGVGGGVTLCRRKNYFLCGSVCFPGIMPLPEMQSRRPALLRAART